MIFEKTIRVPTDRVGVIIGRSGRTKSEIELACTVCIGVDSKSGEIKISASGDVERMRPFKAVEIVSAMGRGFSPSRAMKLLDGENALYVIDLREFAGRSPAQIERIKGRLIGEGGKARRNMERLSDTLISVYGRTVSIIGEAGRLKIAVDAVTLLCNGRMHGTVYGRLESVRRRDKMERAKLWKGQNVF